jgi:microcystin-dependent protein
MMIMRTWLVFVLAAGLAVTGFAQDALSVNPDGDVGIGTTTPSEKLDVDGNIKASGRIMDATGFVMPVGSIMPYGGTTAPDGWLICDGTAVSRTTYADLFTVVGTAFGGGDGVTTFNLPDLRGTFLRGRDAGAGRDPDAGGREEMASGGSTGDTVGSVQADAMQRITGYFGGGRIGNTTHYSPFSGGAFTHSSAGSQGASGANTALRINFDSANSPNARTSTETRPINAYVNFIIKI